MSYKVIVDSCGELTPEMKASGIFETASLTIEVGGHHIVDDETFDQKQFLQYVAEAAGYLPSLLVHHRKNIWKSMTVMWIGCTQ